ncbi:MAG: sodium ion-translocating decarboxylase subunit beta [Firmicutes bacterium]|nr:sodium ion-translocating decarboxylase subunit beta [Bacillota bacterium]
MSEFFGIFSDAVKGLLNESSIVLFFQGDNYKFLIMICIALFFIYLAIVKKYEPLLLLPIAFGMLLVNIPGTGLMNPPTDDAHGGMLWYLYQGDELSIFPPLIFMGVGVLTDFGPLIANPKSLILGAAAQFGIFAAFLGALALGKIINIDGFDFDVNAAASIGIIGGADGPTAIYTTTKLKPEILSTIAVAAYSYMALIPVIQPPIMRLMTTKEERAIKMEQLRPVSKKEKILFPIITSIVVISILPSTASLIGMLMLGNLFKESGVTDKLATHASEAMMYILSIFIGVTVGATTSADSFLNWQTLGILGLGLAAFAFSTASGVVFGKIMCKLTNGKINPLIGAAGVSAVPMAARVAQKVGQEENPNNYLLMHAMGPNVAGVIGSAVASGIFLTLFGN